MSLVTTVPGLGPARNPIPDAVKKPRVKPPPPKKELPIPSGFELCDASQYHANRELIPTVSVYDSGLRFNYGARRLLSLERAHAQLLVDRHRKRILIRLCEPGAKAARVYDNGIAAAALLRELKILKRRYTVESTSNGVEFTYATPEDADPDEVI